MTIQNFLDLKVILKIIWNPYKSAKKVYSKLNDLMLDRRYKSINIRIEKVSLLDLKQESILFYSPNTITSFRIKTFFNKEPEIIEWIDKYGGVCFLMLAQI